MADALTAPRRASGARALPYLLIAAGAAGLHRHPGAVRHRRLVFAAALQPEPADAARLHLVRALYRSCSRARAFWNTVWVSLLYAVLTVGVELLLGLGIALLLRRSTWLNNTLSIALLLPLMVAPAIAVPDVEADDASRISASSAISLVAARHHRFPLGLGPVERAVHGHPRRCLGLHALHHDPAARRPALAAAPAVRGGRARRRAGELRLLPHHPADADALHHHRGAVPACSTASSSSTSSTP